jgi:hypothetical protein
MSPIVSTLNPGHELVYSETSHHVLVYCGTSHQCWYIMYHSKELGYHVPSQGMCTIPGHVYHPRACVPSQGMCTIPGHVLVYSKCQYTIGEGQNLQPSRSHCYKAMGNRSRAGSSTSCHHHDSSKLHCWLTAMAPTTRRVVPRSW